MIMNKQERYNELREIVEIRKQLYEKEKAYLKKYSTANYEVMPSQANMMHISLFNEKALQIMERELNK